MFHSPEKSNPKERQTTYKPIITWDELPDNGTLYHPRTVVVAGHMPDQKRKVPRSPDTPEARNAMSSAMSAKLNSIDAEAPIEKLVLCSGSAGPDLISVQWALEKNKGGRTIQIEMFFPLTMEEFVEESVKRGDTQAQRDE